ncbi:MAG: hypothetical protein N2515_02525 [Deltaproteobacteria bacterium]|nr:hypothetical protein [Sandaracinaceae bacterium]MCX7807460.1 hypothetical protein [Deltaproteobacteria bacterium]MDW8246151.1 hypothetical protein [Sandaracinaceae bacterium]
MPLETLNLPPAEKWVEQIEGVPLVLLQAEKEELARLRRSIEKGQPPSYLPVLPPYHLSDEDAYILLPEDLAVDFRSIFEDGDLDLLKEAMEESVVALGTLERVKRGEMRFVIEEAAKTQEALRQMRYAKVVELDDVSMAVQTLNELPLFHNTVASAFVDEEGLADMLQSSEYLGTSWRPPPERPELAGVDPTFAWTKRLKDGSIGIEAALFCEYEEMALLLRPAILQIHMA